MKKRFLALGMAAVTAMSSVMTCAAQTAESVSIFDAFSSNTGDENVNGNFDITYTFHNATKDISEKWNNFILEIFDGKGQFLTLRADAYGWTAGEWVVGGAAWTDDNGFKHPVFTGQPEDWTSWVEDMKDADVKINVKRTDNIFKVDYVMEGPSDNSYHISTDITLEGTIADDLMIHLTGEQVDLSNIKFMENKDSETTGTDAEQTPTDPEQTPTDPEQTPTDPEQTPTDPEQTATDVIVSDDGNIKVEYNKEQFGGEVKLVTKQLGAEDEDYEKINLKDFVKDAENISEDIPFVAYNISLMNMENQPVQPNGKITVKIACPDGYDNASSKVYRINSNSSLTNMLAVLKDGYLVFETNHFSTYVITAEDLFAGQGFVYGDANGDGEIDTKDAVMMKKYLAEFDDAKETLDENASDVTGDGKVSSADAVKLLQALAGKDVELGR